MKINDDFRFNKAVEEIWPSLYRRSYKICRNREDALDCMQEALIKAYSHFSEIESFKPWMYATLEKTCLNHIRKQKSRPSMPLLDDIDLPNLITEDQERITVDILIAEAPDDVRAIVLMYYERATWAEMAEVLDMPESTVRHHFRTWANRVRNAYEVTGTSLTRKSGGV
ncbi:MAG TPA: RNA polymerase sigma factor [Fimbriimonadaceae bacterium]|nr:RNA polymerase sigma factor [Fimbriimonadaceae bacterium]